MRLLDICDCEVENMRDTYGLVGRGTLSSGHGHEGSGEEGGSAHLDSVVLRWCCD